MAKLEFDLGLDGLTDLEKDFVYCKLAGLTNGDIQERIGPDVFKLVKDQRLTKIVQDITINRKLRKDIADRVYLEQYIKLIPNAMKIAANSLTGEKYSADQHKWAKFMLTPLNRCLSRFLENTANLELGMTESGAPALIIELDGTDSL